MSNENGVEEKLFTFLLLVLPPKVAVPIFEHLYKNHD